VRRLSLALLLLAAAGCKERPAPAAPPPVDAAPPPPVDAAAPRPDLGPPALAPDTAAQLEALERGNAALAERDFAGALPHFLRAVQGPPSGAAVSALLAAVEALEALDRAPEAAELVERALRLAPAVPEVHFAAGRFFAGQVDHVRAVRHFERALALEPDLLPVYPLLGAVLVKAERPQDAAGTMTRYETRLSRLLKALRSPAETPDARRHAIVDLLALLDDERATEGLIAALRDPHPQVRMAAGGALADAPTAEAVVALSEAVVAETDGVARRVLTANLARARDALAATLGAPPPPTLPPPRAPDPTEKGR
jgi:tetratricopeptide (TPR) repeat protein